MHLICPQCLNAITLTDGRAAGDVTCPACGSAFPAAPAGSTGAFNGAAGSTGAFNGAAGRTVSRFEVLAEIGSGGFGTVFKARDPQLDRVVALKVPRPGQAPSGEHLERFLREARSAAQLRHPSIVPIHEVGQHDGAPYLVSEFVQGTTLADLLSARRPGFRDGAELIARLADALQYAHERGVVHRDVKPSNVLLAEDGTAFLTDFGLAKGDAVEATMTVEGQVLGTPAYMPPEQARGEGHRVDGRADVYSLGVMMYQLLTGELPFRGNTRMLLHQVLHDEPRPPRKLNDQIPRDLETVCLKAMAKEPARRYPKAGELAEDLRRFLRGEPVRARPVGRLVRATRWAQRNPALALAVTAAALFLVVGASVAGWFAVEANHQADDARRANDGLDRKNSELTAKNVELDRDNTELSRSQDRLEGVLVRSWLFALPRHQTDLVTDQEISALKQVAEHRGEALGRRFVRDALTDPALSPRLSARAEYIWQAALALDRKQRNDAERLLLAELRSETHEERRQDLALAAAALGHLSPEAAAAAAEALAPGKAFSEVYTRMEPKEAAAKLTERLNKTTDPHMMVELARLLSAVSARLEPKEAASVCRLAAARLAEAVNKKTVSDSSMLDELAVGLSEMSTRLEPKEGAALLTEAVSKTNDLTALYELADGLAASAARLEPKEAAAACRLVAAKLAEAIATSRVNATSVIPLGLNARHLSLVAAWLEPSEASALCGPAAVRLAEIMKYNSTIETNVLKVRGEAAGLSAVSARLEPKEAAMTASILTEAMSKATSPEILSLLAGALSAVSARLEPKEGVSVCRLAAARLADAVSKTHEPSWLGQLADALTVVVGRLEPKEAAAVCAPVAARLAEAMSKTDEPHTLHQLAVSLSAVSARVEPTEAASVCRLAAARLAEALKYNSYSLGQLAAGLSAVSVRLEPKEAAAVCRLAAARLAEAVSKTDEPGMLQILSGALSAVSARLEPKEAAAVCAPVAARLAEAMSKTTDPQKLAGLADALSAVSAQLEPKEASAVCGSAAAKLAEAMSKTHNPFELRILANTLTEVAGRLEPKEAAEARGPAAAGLIEAIRIGVDSPQPSSVVIRSQSEDSSFIRRSLSMVLSGEYPFNHYPQRYAQLAGAVAGLSGPAPLFMARALLEPPLPPLPAQRLVDLLKMPQCVGDVRRLVLDQLSRRYGRPFADQWDFARFAEEQNLGLDLTSPPPPAP